MTGMAAIEAIDLHAGPGAPVWRVLGDEQLARAATRGNDHAFAALYARYAGALRRYCASIVLNSEDAEDALQATMLKALRAMPGRRAAVPVKPWLYRIAHNESVDLVRRRRAHSQVDDDRVAALAAPGPEAELARRERLAELVIDLRMLPERQRAALLMRELSGLGYDEIADSLEVTPGAVRQLVFEARSTLHEYARGRDVACESVQRSLSDGDRRRRRARSVRAHLRACDTCRDFDRASTRRRGDLAALPPLGLEGTAAAIAASGGFLGLLGLAGSGSVAGIVGGTATKGIATAALAIAVGAGAAIETRVEPIRGEQEGRRAPRASATAPAAQPRSALATPTPRAATWKRPATPAGKGRGARRTASDRAQPRSVAVAQPGTAIAYVPRVRVGMPVVPEAVPKAVAPPAQAPAANPTADAVGDRAEQTARAVTQRAVDQARQTVAQSQSFTQQVIGQVQETVQQTVTQVQHLLERILRR